MGYRNTSLSKRLLPTHTYANNPPFLPLQQDQPLLRLPFELLRKNFRSAHFEVEKEGSYIKNTLKETATSAVNGRAGQEDVLRNLDAMLARVRGVKRKLGAFAEEENRLQKHEEARAHHLAELYAMHGVDDVKYEVWSRTRLDRLLVDYLLRRGYGASARELARERGIELLVDVETFEQMSRIRKSLLAGSVTEALAWCTAGDTKKELRKINVRIYVVALGCTPVFICLFCYLSLLPNIPLFSLDVFSSLLWDTN